MNPNRNAEFVKVARVKFAELRAEYQTLVICDNDGFNAYVHEHLELTGFDVREATPFDYLCAAAYLVREAHSLSTMLDAMALEAENQGILEAEHFVSADTERSWT